MRSASFGREVRGGVKGTLEPGFEGDGDVGGAEPLAGSEEGKVARLFFAVVSGVGDEERERLSGDSEGRGRP